MAYTAENIANIKRDGNLDSYLEHDRKLAESLFGAEIEYGKQGDDSVSLAHLYGRYGIDTAENAAVAYIVGDAWSRQWSLDNFGGDQRQALAYAKGALASELKQLRGKVLDEARARVTTLEAVK